MASNQLLDSLHLRGFLSFGPESEPVKLTGLNVLIGPNGVGKSNFIEAIELLHATPTDFAGAIRLGGMPSDWIWHGEPKISTAKIEAVLTGQPRLRYEIEFAEESEDESLRIQKETLENAENSFSYYSGGFFPCIKVLDPNTDNYINLDISSWDSEQSIFSMEKYTDEDLCPAIARVGHSFKNIKICRDWEFSPAAAFRNPQPINSPVDGLSPQTINLGRMLNDLEHRPEWERFEELMSRFLPGCTRLSTKIFPDSSIQVYLHEEGLNAPIPATRLSNGTLRFLTFLAILLNPGASPLICIDEPEMGLHPDAVALLADVLLEASEKTQLIVTTHSDTLVSALTYHAESVLVCDNVGGGTELRRLESEKLAYWLEKYLLGDIWRMGDLGGNP
jgi:predicted ATPase